GVFMMPALLAVYGGISILGWLLSTLGAVLVAILFSRFSKLMPGIQGGPYAFTRKGLGEFPGFLVAWGYWISVWTTNAALAVAFVSYLSVIFPVLGSEMYYSIGSALAVIWGLSWFNTLGVGKVGKMSLITTVLKLLPIVAIGATGIFYINVDHFIPLNLSQESNWTAIIATSTLTFFSYLGIESATIPAENIKDPETNIPFATKWGTLIAAFVYILSSISILGLISPETLSMSGAPFSDAAELLWGSGAKIFVTLAAIISVFGALNGWILIQGQMPEAIARDNLFPTLFKKKNKRGIPAMGIFISSVLASILIVMNYSGSLMEVFKFMILVSTVSVLIPYIFCAISYMILMPKKTYGKLKNFGILALASSTLIFSLIALIGSGFDSVFWGLLFLMIGLPVYAIMEKSKISKT
ncbi:MAG: amino acid permease, partial [Saprospiraceae bacterium]|nr:amino acid permease [Saprospiraceae bacterium]